VSSKEVIIPDIGGVTDVDVIEVCVKPGDRVATEDALIVLESDKASMDVPSTASGVVKELKVAVGDKVNEGDLILLLETEEVSSAELSSAEHHPDAVQTSSEPVPTAVSEQAAQPVPEASGGSKIETILVPDIGGVEGVTVIEIAVAVGDQVGVDDAIVVLESDKAAMDVPSPFAGTITKLLVEINASVDEGSPLAKIEVITAEADPMVDGIPVLQADTGAGSGPATIEQPSGSTASSMKSRAEVVPPPPLGLAPHGDSAKVHAGPAVRRMAREFGVDLTMVQGSGPKGRVVKEDVQAFVKSGLQQLKSGVGPATGTTGVGLPTVTLPDFSQFGAISRSPMTRIHQLTAENMSRSWLTVPHVTQFDKADITDLESFRKAQKTVAEGKGIRLTPLAFVIKACAYALQSYAQFNVSLDMDKHEVIQKHFINIGVAVDTPGGLVVPVLRNVDSKGIWDIATEFAELAEKAKAKKLKAADMQGGCFTISSLGSIGGSAFTPIVNSPEVSILGLSKAQIEPVYKGDVFVPRLMLPLSLSYDHRAINGADAARFTGLLARLLGDIRNLLL